MIFKTIRNFGIFLVALSLTGIVLADFDSSATTQNSTQTGLLKNSRIKIIPEIGMVTHGYRETDRADFSQSAFQIGLNGQYHFDNHWFLASTVTTTAAPQTREGDQTARFTNASIQVAQKSFGWNGPLDATFGGGLFYSSMSQTSQGEGYGRFAAPMVSAEFRRHVSGPHALGVSTQFVSIFKNAADLSFPGYRACLGIKYFFHIQSINEITLGLEGSTQKFDRSETTFRENDVALNLSYPL